MFAFLDMVMVGIQVVEHGVELVVEPWRTTNGT
jgi:hypothetical protein